MTGTEMSVFVRMYKRILGDCFLLRIEEGDKRAHILIDCGVLQGTKGADRLMNEVARDIVKMTGGDVDKGIAGKLDLLVVTHEHWDHISGFSLAREIFFDRTKLEIENIWFAWTESLVDVQANALRDRFLKSNRVVAALAKEIAAKRKAEPVAFTMDSSLAFGNLQEFLGVEAGEPITFKTSKLKTKQGPRGDRLTGGRIMTQLAKMAAKPPECLEPGTMKERTPGPVGLRTYVLGPPRDEDKLFKALAGADDEHKHFSAPTFNDDLLFAMAGVPKTDGKALAGAGLSQADERVAQSPFSKRHRGIREADVRRGPEFSSGTEGDDGAVVREWLRNRYFDKHPPCRLGPGHHAGHDCATDMVCRSDQTRKRIDGNWLAAAGQFAMKLDGDTNNTSLVLAFELPDRRVMLFAADAQVGNWESWADHEYDGETLDALLGRVAFYKVGHHGSHNATRVETGLKKMNLSNKEPMVAMIPTDEAFALQQGASGKGWKMPAEVVRTPLLAKTQGQTLYGDRMWGKLPGSEDPDPNFLPFGKCADFDERLVQTEDYVEYRIYGPASATPEETDRKPA